MKKKRITALLLAASMVLGTSACGGSGGAESADSTTGQEQEPQQESGSETTELTLLMGNDWVDESKELGAEFTKVIGQYQEEHPEVKITLQGASQQDIKESFQTAALAGGGADIVTMDNSGHAIDLAAMGLLYPLRADQPLSGRAAKFRKIPGGISFGSMVYGLLRILL